MFIFVRFLVRRAPTPPISHPDGWIELPDGRLFKPSPHKIKFVVDQDKPLILRVRQRRRLGDVLRHCWTKLIGLSA